MQNRDDLYVITDLQQIKALADPLRQRILGAFVAEPRTTKQVATALGQPPTKLYHHVDLLERVGLLRLVETKPKRGTTERYLQAIANRFTVAGSSLGGEAATVIEETLAEAFAAAQSEIRRAVATGAVGDSSSAAETIMALGEFRLTPEDLMIVRDRIVDISKGLGEDKSRRKAYRYLVTIYPAPASSEPSDEHAAGTG